MPSATAVATGIPATSSSTNSTDSIVDLLPNLKEMRVSIGEISTPVTVMGKVSDYSNEMRLAEFGMSYEVIRSKLNFDVRLTLLLKDTDSRKGFFADLSEVLRKNPVENSLKRIIVKVGLIELFEKNYSCGAFLPVAEESEPGMVSFFVRNGSVTSSLQFDYELVSDTYDL